MTTSESRRFDGRYFKTHGAGTGCIGGHGQGGRRFKKEANSERTRRKPEAERAQKSNVWAPEKTRKKQTKLKNTKQLEFEY